jgi:O-antigen/teichoic acid export membrane protein
MLGDARGFTYLSVATLVVSFVCAVALVNTMQKTAQYWVLGLILGQMLLAVIGSKMLLAKLKLLNDSATMSPNISRLHIRVLFHFSWPVALAAGFGWVQLQGYRFIMESQLGLAQLGLFVAGYSISSGLISSFESILTAYLQPRFYRETNKDLPSDQAKAWRQYASVVIPSLILTVTLIITLAPEFTRVLLGERFQEAASFVVWGALAEAARVLCGVYSLIAHVYMRTRWLIVPNAVGAALSIVLCVLLLPQLGAQGAGIALSLAGFVVVAMLHILMTPRAGGSLHIHVIGWTVLASASLCVATLVIRALFNTVDSEEVIGVIGATGLVYLGLMYSLLNLEAQHVGNQIIMKIILVCMVHTYGDQKREKSFEYFNFYKVLCDMGHEVEFFDYMGEMKAHGKAVMNQRLLERVRDWRPALAVFSLYTDQFEVDAIKALRMLTKTYCFFL